MDAARAWAAGSGRDVDILPANNQAAEVFLAVSTQWETNEQTGIPKRIPRTDLESTLNMLGIDDQRSVLQAIQIMELAALEVFMANART